MPRQLPPTITAAKLPEWLPPGWIMESKVLRTGRKIRSYTHLKSGRKFSTKDDVLQYVEMEKVREKKLQSKYRETEMYIEYESMNALSLVRENDVELVAKADERPDCLDHQPEWLPDTWVVGVRARENDRSSHVKDIVETNDHPQWLPDNWMMEERTRRNGKYKGKKIKVYTDVLTGQRFYSKRRLLWYLGYPDCETSAEEQEKTSTSVDSSSKPLLPAKRQKQEHPAARRQLFAGEDSDLLPEMEASRQGEDVVNPSEAGLATSPIAEVPAEEHLVNVAVGLAVQTKENSSLSSSIQLLKAEGHQGYQLISVPIDTRPVSHPATDILLEHKLHESGIGKIRMTNTEQTSKGFTDKKETNLPCQTNSMRKNEMTQQVNSDPDMELATTCERGREFPENKAFDEERQPRLQTAEAIADKSKPSVLLSFGSPSSDKCLEFAYKTLTGTIPVDDLTNHGLVSTTPAADTLQQKKLCGNKRQKSSTRRCSSQKTKKKDTNLLPKSLEQFAEPEMVPSMLLGERIGGTVDRKSRTMRTGRNICLTSNGVADGEYKLPEFESEMGFAYRNPVNINSPLLEGSSRESETPMERQEDHLSDLCLEFSFKTLIGATAMEDDSVLRNYLEQQFYAGGTEDGNFPLPDFGLPTFSQIEVSPDAPDDQPTITKQWPVNPSCMQLGNDPSFPSCSVIGS